MSALLRNLARRWADARMVRANDTLRRQLLAAEATIGRLRQQCVRYSDRITNLTGREQKLVRDANGHERAQAELREFIARQADQIEAQADRIEQVRAEGEQRVKRAEAQRDAALTVVAAARALQNAPNVLTAVVDVAAAVEAYDTAARAGHETRSA